MWFSVHACRNSMCAVWLQPWKFGSLNPDSTLSTTQISQLCCCTFKCSSGTCANTQSVWFSHCVLHCRTDPIGSWNVPPTQSLQNGSKNKCMHQIITFQVSVCKRRNLTMCYKNSECDCNALHHTTGNYMGVVETYFLMLTIQVTVEALQVWIALNIMCPD